MNVLKANIINELQKLFLKKKVTVLLIITAIICFLSAFLISSIKTKLVFIAVDSISFPLIILTIFTNIFLPLFIFMTVAELFSGELGNKSLKLVLVRPISRLKIFISKNIAIAIYIIINLTIVFIVSMSSSMIINAKARFSIPHIMFAYFIDLVPAMVLALFASFIAQFFKNSSGAIITCILSFIGIKILSLFVSGLNNIVFTSYLNWYSIWSIGQFSFLRTINTLFMVLSYGVIFFTAGYYFFDKKEV
ncbi:ABC transporter permease [Clostridium estertheticum]|uniref:ABC transporter permease n=1 Tax=Clostridium estertheticum TaxID=238834 RepID=UPI001C7E0F8E|nr:ABC transporter permease [Clostridium estertheticum]MBX4270957.1 ABC transporter permease subunit [Clostridium estertheticum]WLC81188.1 ABC transporter permease subunit [Clostridium estertheticum]